MVSDEGESSWIEDGTNVFRESKEVSLLTSTLDMRYLQKTMLLFSCDEYHMQCCGSWRDPVGRAICERSHAACSLKARVRFHSQH